MTTLCSMPSHCGSDACWISVTCSCIRQSKLPFAVHASRNVLMLSWTSCISLLVTMLFVACLPRFASSERPYLPLSRFCCHHGRPPVRDSSALAVHTGSYSSALAYLCLKNGALLENLRNHIVVPARAELVFECGLRCFVHDTLRALPVSIQVS